MNIGRRISVKLDRLVFRTVCNFFFLNDGILFCLPISIVTQNCIKIGDGHVRFYLKIS